MAWTIEYTETARRELRKLDRQVAKRIVGFMDERVATVENPRDIGHGLAGSVLGGLWRYRVGDCRVICEIQDEQIRVLVLRVGNRREIYR